MQGVHEFLNRSRWFYYGLLKFTRVKEYICFALYYGTMNIFIRLLDIINKYRGKKI